MKRWYVLLASGRFCFWQGKGKQTKNVCLGLFATRSSRNSENFARFVRDKKANLREKNKFAIIVRDKDVKLPDLFATKKPNCQICSRAKEICQIGVQKRGGDE